MMVVGLLIQKITEEIFRFYFRSLLAQRDPLLLSDQQLELLMFCTTLFNTSCFLPILVEDHVTRMENE